MAIASLERSISFQEETYASCDRKHKAVKSLPEDIHSDLSFLPKACHDQPAMEKFHKVKDISHNCVYSCIEKIGEWLEAARATKNSPAASGQRCGFE